MGGGGGRARSIVSQGERGRGDMKNTQHLFLSAGAICNVPFYIGEDQRVALRFLLLFRFCPFLFLVFSREYECRRARVPNEK